MERRIKRSVSIAIRNADEVLVVQRPDNDEDLPNAWGLPAASLRKGEDWIKAAKRAACEKLGVDVEIGKELERGTLERKDYTLAMRLFEAKIIGGAPSAPQPDATVTQYQLWRWGGADDLKSGAERGSLCRRLYFRTTLQNSDSS